MITAGSEATTVTLDGPLTWPIEDGADKGVWPRFSITTPTGKVWTEDQALAEDVATIPLMRRQLEQPLDREMHAGRVVPVQRSEHDLLVSLCGLVEELLMEVRRGNSLERTGSVSSVQIEDYPTKDRPVRVTSKVYAGSPLPVDEALADHARLHREAEERAMNGWFVTVGSVRNKATS